MLNLELSHNSNLASNAPILHVSGAEPFSEVTLSAKAIDSRGQIYKATAEFLSDHNGAVRTHKSPSLAGSFRGKDKSGLFWSLSPVDKDLKRPSFGLDNLHSLKMTFSAQDNLTSRTSIQSYNHVLKDENVETISVHENNVVLNAYLPQGRTKCTPTVLVLGGYGGKFRWSNGYAKLLASHGIAAIAVAYVGFRELPNQSFKHIDLTYFDHVLAKLEQYGIIGSDVPLGLLGCSMGGQLALMLASLNPRFQAVSVCGSPTYVTGAVGGHMYLLDTLTPRKILEYKKACWLSNGRIIPFLKARFDWKNVWRFIDQNGVEFSGVYDYLFKKPEKYEYARIPIERINGKTLFFSGSEDRLFKAGDFAEMALHHMSRSDRKRFTHYHYEGAGHIFRLPNTPTTNEWFYDTFKINMGGNPASSASAYINHWNKIVAFF